MLKMIYPDIYVDSIHDIALDELKKSQIKGFIMDLDNTITLWNSNEISMQVEEWFKKIKSMGFKACILSNNGEKRIVKVAQQLDIPFIHRAAKPNPRSFLRAMHLMGLQREETAVIGDQLFTDMLGGNRAGFFTILVVPLDRREFIGTKISRMMEKMVIHKIQPQKGKK
ncbi:MAG: YqeG family HAD IIIA-type phosphatase [Syntrophomonadaceae bacterium]|jgi:HAD superfamily phosphatase (TIGR01668 family)|nr:YqeG family HAD IIIA-type phosphatase [Syntrophomonadaceae bacterium]